MGEPGVRAGIPAAGRRGGGSSLIRPRGLMIRLAGTGGVLDPMAGRDAEKEAEQRWPW